MKILYIVRHAKSSWDHDNLDDFERPLNARGHRDAILMGKFLREHKVITDLIIASPANRAAMTAKLLSEQIKYPLTDIMFNASLYLATQRELCKVLKETVDSCNHLMIIGHNPGLTSLIHELADDSIPNLPTCGIYAIQFQVKSWKELQKKCGKKVFYEYPRLHEGGGNAE
jgi:phosphohistidine phosphatase